MEDQAQQTSDVQSTSQIKKYLPLLGILAFMGVAFSQGWHNYLSFKELALNLDNLRAFITANYIPAILLYILAYAVLTALSFPSGIVITVAGGLLFGWFVGTLATVTGATIGATILFLAAKTSLGEHLKSKAGPFLEKLQKGFEENALSYMFFLRLVPAFPFWLINLAPALLGVKLSTYFIATFFGIIPGTLAFSYVGQGLESVIVAQKNAYQACLDGATSTAAGNCKFEFDTSSLITPDLLIAFALLAIVALLPVAIKKFRKQ